MVEAFPLTQIKADMKTWKLSFPKFDFPFTSYLNNSQIPPISKKSEVGRFIHFSIAITYDSISFDILGPFHYVKILFKHILSKHMINDHTYSIFILHIYPNMYIDFM